VICGDKKPIRPPLSLPERSTSNWAAWQVQEMRCVAIADARGIPLERAVCLGNQKSGSGSGCGGGGVGGLENRSVLDASHELFRLSGKSAKSEANGQPSQKKTRAKRPKKVDADANAAGRRWQRQRQRQRQQIVPVAKAKVGACKKGAANPSVGVLR